jgi:hypothetical protein
MTWSLMPNGTVIARAKTRSVLDWARILKAPPAKKLRIDGMNPWR